MTSRAAPCAIVPYLAYADAPAAIDFLVRAFGFEEESRMEMEDGRIGHAELRLGDTPLFLASVYPELGFASPQDLQGIHTQLFCTVDDVDRHYARARDAGATVISMPRDREFGHREYRALDCEGGRWIFAAPLPA
jgi:uncharacterized glyoxalase superfamily protein PhnB